MFSWMFYLLKLYFQNPDLRLKTANETKKWAMSSSSQTAFRSRSKTLPLPARVKIEKKIVQEPKTRSSFPFRRLVRLSVNCKYVRCIVRGRVKQIKYHATIYCFSGACVHLCLAVIHSLICVFYSRLFYHCFIKVRTELTRLVIYVI